jgi:hypothetical protein
MHEGPTSRSRVAARIAGLAVLKDVQTCAPAQRAEGKTLTAKCRRAASQRAHGASKAARRKRARSWGDTH